jgi:hypothetical protein
MDILLWALGLLIVIQTTVMGFIAKAMFDHIKECREFRAEVSGIATDMKRVKEDIGTHETGMRGSIHDLRNRVTPVVLWYERDKR